MESGKHEQQKTVVSNKIKAFLLVKVQMTYGKWQHNLNMTWWVREWKKYYQWYEYMVTVKHALQGTFLSKKLKHFWSRGYNELWQVARKYGKWHQDIVQKMKGYN